MQLTLSDSQKQIIALVEQFAGREIAPHTASWDREDHFPVEVFRRLGDLGLLGLPIPETYGGAGASMGDYVAAVEALAKADPGLSCAFSVHVSAHTRSILDFGTEEQKRKYLPELCSGRMIGAFALTEPNCGSDASALRTRAVRDGDEWVLDGTKQWITNAKSAGLFLLFARTNPDEPGAKGISAFLIEAGTPGLEIGRKTHKMGMRTSETYDLVLSSCRIPASALIGEVGGGFAIAMKTLEGGRIGIAAQATGIAQAALDHAKTFSEQREAFGKPINRFQAIQWKIADMATRVTAARLLTYRAAQFKDLGQPCNTEGAMAKLFASRVAREATNESLQIHGGYGYTDEFAIERLYRDAKVTEIYEGTSEIQKIVISRALLGADRGKVQPAGAASPARLETFEGMDFRLGDEQRMLQEMARDLANQTIAPRAAELDRTGTFPRENFDVLAANGLLGIPYPEEFNGAGSDHVSYVVALEEICRACASTGVTMSVQTSLASAPLNRFGTPEQKRKYLAPLLAGETIGAYSLSEAGAGTDAASLQCRARKDGDHYVLDGTKMWVTNGYHADTYIVYATLDPTLGHRGICAFIVEKGTPGFTFGKKEDKLGIRASSTYELIFQNCRVPVENLLGQEGEGFKVAMWTLDGGRIGIAAQAIGIAQAAFEQALKYTREREQFGKRIADNQAIAFSLAEMATDIQAARLLMYRAAHLKDRGENHTQAASMAKLFASETAMWVATRAVQLHGGYGFTTEFPAERFMRDAKITEIYEGTSEVQRMVIARQELASRS
jgi:butyryl-CoA dehydrogenase